MRSEAGVEAGASEGSGSTGGRVGGLASGASTPGMVLSVPHVLAGSRVRKSQTHLRMPQSRPRWATPLALQVDGLIGDALPVEVAVGLHQIPGGKV